MRAKDLSRFDFDAALARRAKKRRRTRGVATVEYAFLLAVVGIPVLIGTIASGVSLVAKYTAARDSILHVGP